MAITKCGENIQKQAFLAGVYGFGRGKDDDRAFSGLRNAVRGEVGGVAGATVGALGGRFMGNLLTRSHPVGGAIGQVAGGITGYGTGAHKMTNKFAPQNIDKE